MRLFIIICIIFSSSFSYAQTPTGYDKATQLYTQVIQGERKFDSLSPAEQQQVLTVQQLFVSSCGNLRGKCRDTCEAANELKSAADDLSNCAKRHDYTNDCRSRYRDTKDKFEQYENAVSDASGDCS